jgi:hypothetical protein
MKWRQIGPFRDGRVLAVAGVPGDPNTYYFGAVAGGIFKSTNGGMTRTPTFDHQSVSSFGAIAVVDADQPTDSQLQVYDELHTRLTAQRAKWQQIQTTDVVALNDLLRKNGAASVTVGAGLGG